MWKKGLMREFHWALSLSVAACLMGAPARADRFDDRFGEVVVVTHVDVDPQNVAVAERLLVNFVVDSRNDRGVKSFTLITQEGTDNHFQLIEFFQDMRAFDAHVSAAHTVTFRANLDPLLGAPYDERLYQVD